MTMFVLRCVVEVDLSWQIGLEDWRCRVGSWKWACRGPPVHSSYFVASFLYFPSSIARVTKATAVISTSTWLTYNIISHCDLLSNLHQLHIFVGDMNILMSFKDIHYCSCLNPLTSSGATWVQL